MFRASLAGFQTIGHSFRMKRQQILHLCLVALVTVVLVTGWSLWALWQTNPQQVKAALFHVRADHFSFWQDDTAVYRFTHADGRPGSVTAGHVRASPAFRQARDQVTARVIKGGRSGLWMAGGVVLLLQLVYWVGGRLLMRKRVLDGAELVSARRLNKITHRRRSFLKSLLWRDEPYRIAGIEWPYGSETLHMLINGSTGSGKTTEMSNLIDQIRARGQKAIIYDKMGSYIPPFHNAGTDIILNPLDERSANWDIFAEAQHDSDFDMMAAALIPEHRAAPDPFWADAARSLFSSAAATLWKTGNRDIRKLLQLLVNADLKDLAEAMQGTVAQSIVDPDIHRTALSVRTVLTTRLRALFHLKHDEASFSIREWVQDGRPGILFISSQARVHETLRAMIATQLEIALVSLLSMPADRRRRIWTFIDELPTLHRIPSLVSALSESRQFGGCMVLGTQVNSALRSIYGKDDAETILGNCNTRLLLHTPDEATAREGERTLGMVRRRWMARNVSYGENRLRDGVSWSEREETVPAVPASALMALPELHGILKMPRDLPPTRVRLKPGRRRVKAAHFIPAERVDPHTGEVYAINPATGAIRDAATDRLAAWERELDSMQPGLFGQLTGDTPVEPDQPSGGAPAGAATVAHEVSAARLKVTERTQVDVKLSAEEMYRVFGFDQYGPEPLPDVPAHFDEVPPPETASGTVRDTQDERQLLPGIEMVGQDAGQGTGRDTGLDAEQDERDGGNAAPQPVAEEPVAGEPVAEEPAAEDLSAYRADGVDPDTGHGGSGNAATLPDEMPDDAPDEMSDRPSLDNPSSSMPSGAQDEDMQSETDAPATRADDDGGTDSADRSNDTPHGQGDADRQQGTRLSSANPDYQAAMDFQAPGGTNTDKVETGTDAELSRDFWTSVDEVEPDGQADVDVTMATGRDKPGTANDIADGDGNEARAGLKETERPTDRDDVGARQSRQATGNTGVPKATGGSGDRRIHFIEDMEGQ